jgi:hypothetical protein
MKILARQQPIKLRNSPKQLPAIYIKEYLHFLGLTFTVQYVHVKTNI